MKEITYTRKALRDLAKMPTNVSTNVREKINLYAREPETLANNVIKLQGVSGYQLRVGDYRVIFDEDDTVIEVLRVRPRGDAY